MQPLHPPLSPALRSAPLGGAYVSASKTHGLARIAPLALRAAGRASQLEALRVRTAGDSDEQQLFGFRSRPLFMHF